MSGKAVIVDGKVRNIFGLSWGASNVGGKVRNIVCNSCNAGC